MNVAQIAEKKAADLYEAEVWVKAHQAEIPLCVYNAVLLLTSLRLELGAARQRATNLLALFRRELGVSAKSESGKAFVESGNKPQPSDEDRLAALKARRAKLLGEIRRYEDRLGKGRKKKQTQPLDSSPPRTEPAEPVFVFSKEALFVGNIADRVDEDKPLKVNRMENFDIPRGLHSVSDKRTRQEFGITTKTIHLSVETVTDPRTGKSVTASTDEIGPPNTQATWAAIANTIVAVIGYAIPINRLATMLKGSNPYFTSTRLCSYLKMSAELFAPIYTCLGEQLSDSDVLLGDDTKGRVIEINRALKNGGELGAPPEGSLVSKISEAFGRTFAKKKGKGQKRSLNISVVIGKSEASDPRSYIFFFRAHLGTLGDLLTKMLETRSPKKKELTLVSDLATTNLVSAELYQKFEITHAGCAAHARRPFWRHKDKDQRLCYWMLSAFLVLEQIEDRIDELGRTKARIERYRQRYSRKVWAIIRRRCESVMRGEKIYGHHWPKTSELYIACNYIVKHYEKLTAYLDDPRLPSNNNLSERVLRWDKIMEDASKFRMTEAGRLHVDILRTIVHTCSAAQVELKDYLLFIFKNREVITADPTRYTPYAYALMLDAAKN
ncbi:MAG: IS66 family transposase [Oligoflexus sp.]